VSEGEVDCVYQTIIEKALVDGKTVMEKSLVRLELLGLIGLIMKALGVVVAQDKTRGFLLLEFFKVILLRCHAVSTNQASIPHVLLRNIESEAKLLVAASEEAEESDSLDVS
jgi:hypothetical protein